MAGLVLLVEDDRLLSGLMLAMLARLAPDCRVMSVRDGAAAIDLARQHAGDLRLVLLDVLLPRVNGLDVMRVVRDSAAPRHVPVIVISALGLREVVRQALAAGADDFIVKPFDMDLLAGKVEKALAGGRA